MARQGLKGPGRFLKWASPRRARPRATTPKHTDDDDDAVVQCPAPHLTTPSSLPFFLSIQTLSCCCGCYGCPCHSYRCWRRSGPPPSSSSSRTTCGVADGRTAGAIEQPISAAASPADRATATSARPTRRTIQFDLVCVCHEATRRYKREDCPD